MAETSLVGRAALGGIEVSSRSGLVKWVTVGQTRTFMLLWMGRGRGAVEGVAILVGFIGLARGLDEWGAGLVVGDIRLPRVGEQG